MSVLLEIAKATAAGDIEKVAEMTRRAVEEKIEAERIVKEGFMATMQQVGDDFAAGRIYIPEMLIAARAMKSGLEVLRPLMIGKQVEPIGKVVLGTVKGDLHDIGKNLVGMMLEGIGFEVVDLGVDVPAQKFIDAVTENRPRFLGLSALLTTTMGEMKTVIDSLSAAGLRSSVKVFVGGAPVSQQFAASIGCDGYADNAGEAARLMKAMLQ
jgi:5-methyltetrahydrofolate--homocysteine methyltransferase